jgi:iron complex transport system substrate-binding protein
MKRDLRILSLLPSSTEIVCLLGLEDKLVGRSHDSDYPAAIRKKPVVTRTEITSGQSSRSIDTFVREATHQGRSLYHLETNLLTQLRPNLILSQEFDPTPSESYPLAGVMSRLCHLVY